MSNFDYEIKAGDRVRISFDDGRLPVEGVVEGKSNQNSAAWDIRDDRGIVWSSHWAWISKVTT